MAKHKRKKGFWSAQYYTKDGALSWRGRKKNKAWLLGLIFYTIKTLAIENTQPPSLEEIAQVYSYDFARDNTLSCKGQCNLRLKYRLTSSELYQAGAKNLLEALKLFPFTFFVKDDLNRPILGLHSIYGPGRVLFLLNGQRINNPYDGLTFLDLPTDTIDYIEIHYGPGGTEFGDSSLSGTVIIVTKKMPHFQAFGLLDNNAYTQGGFLANGQIGTIKSGIFTTLWMDFDKKNPKVWSNLYFDIELIKNSRTYLNSDIGFIIESKDNWVFNGQAHIIKKSATKKTIDIFTKNIFFKTNQYLALDSETGIESEFRPILGHNIIVGSGAKLLSVFKDEQMVKKKTIASCRIIKGLENIFHLCNGQLYFYGQDEWQIRPPFFVIFGTRIVLPLEKKSISPEILPTIGMVVIPSKKWRYKISFQSSFRIPSFDEPISLDYERMNTFEGALWFGDKFGDLIMMNNFSIHLSKIDDFIDKDKENKLTNGNELDLIGLRFSTDFKINHCEVSFGLGYSWVLHKEFDETGYAKCKVIPFNLFSSLPQCTQFLNVPPFSAYFKASFDLLAYGNLNIFASFYRHLDKNNDNNSISLLDISYASKTFWRYISIWAALKNLLEKPIIKQDLSSHKTSFFLGVNVKI